MNAKQLSAYKENAEAQAMKIVGAITDISPNSVRSIYPEFNCRDGLTTSLEPDIPLQVMLPFFPQIIVGIVSCFPSEAEFKKWYGVSVKQLLDLHERGRVLIRVHLPKAGEIPSYLTPFYKGQFPSSVRDRHFVDRLLGDRLPDLRARFRHNVNYKLETTHDNPGERRQRSFPSTEMTYLQLHAFGYSKQACQFESYYKEAPEAAMRWLECCRQLLISPYSYSFLGIHSINKDKLSVPLDTYKNTLRFPGELARIMADTCKLVQHTRSNGTITLKNALAIHPDFELARETLLKVDTALKSEQGDRAVTLAKKFNALVKKASTRQKLYFRCMHWLIASGITVSGSLLHERVGLLAALGYEIISDSLVIFNDKTVKGLINSGATGVVKRQSPHLGLILKLDESVKRSIFV
jgi:hypothetical protein